jgi:hypothetical protein
MPLPIALTQWLTAPFTLEERCQVAVIFSTRGKTYEECSPEEQAEIDKASEWGERVASRYMRRYGVPNAGK